MSEPVVKLRRRAPKRRRGCLVGSIAVAVLLAILVAGAFAAWQTLYRPTNPVAAGQPVEFTVTAGQSVQEIGIALAAEGIVANPNMFRWEARNSDKATSLKPGTYSLATGMPYDLVLDKLASGPDIVYFDVTIPEGFTARRVAARVAKVTGVSEDEMLDLVLHGAPIYELEHPYLEGSHDGSLEGFLFPKTYKIKEGTKPETIVGMMLDQFDEEIATVDLSYAESKNLNVRDVVTIASIIEREVRLEKEYPLVSSVVYNRLKLPMRLQLDSTVFYGLPEGTKILTKADLAEHTPWNTYRRDGLPLTPICNPGIKAVKAAAKPKKTKYLYYVLTSKDGSQTFATNYDDFLKAVRKYRDLFGY
ncbi:MAG: endolytic transglycosylase MltG [Coriobacteriia bacterium]|nr:endolytic transglycosylase MltG [Coriobacteriia bacterium]